MPLFYSIFLFFILCFIDVMVNMPFFIEYYFIFVLVGILVICGIKDLIKNIFKLKIS